MAKALLCLLCALPLSQAMSMGGLPKIDPEFATQFEDTPVIKVKSPMSLAITPDGSKMFVTQKEGYIHLVEDFQPKYPGANVYPPSRTVLDISLIMCSNGERALGGIAVHPEFGTKNNWIYLYYTFNKYNDCDDSVNVNTGPVNRFSRWEFDESTGIIDPKSEKVFFDTPRVPAKLHNSGDIAFGKDGNVYVTVGDGGGRTIRNARGVVYPQALDHVFGKIIRLTDEGDIPPGNPFVGDDDAVVCGPDGRAPEPTMKCLEIYTTGHRNPIRFAMNPNTPDGVTEYYVNEVGRAVWEEISKGGDGYAGANYGYPRRTGKCIEDSETNCVPPDESEGFTDPVHWYKHDEEHGGCVAGAAFVPNDIGWPSSFTDAYLYADYAIGGIYVMTPGGKGCEYPECKVPVSPFAANIKALATHESIIYMAFGPNGVDENGNPRHALYYVSRDGGVRGVHKIEFTGDGNRNPKAQISAAPLFGFIPLKVEFDGAISFDPDGDGLTYEWDLDGDGKIDSTSAKPSFEYNEPGSFDATLTVRDGKGGVSKTQVRIEAENTPPTPKILSPLPGTKFAVGEKFELIGAATDGEDGDLDDSSLTWEVRQHHNTHYHPFVDPDTPGNNIIIEAPEPEDFDASLTSNLEILLTATDSRGLSSTTTVRMYPNNVEVLLDSVPRGLDVVAYGDVFVTPKIVTTWENHVFEVEAYDQEINGDTYNFASWDDGGAQMHEVEAQPSAGEDVSSEVREDGVAKNVMRVTFTKNGKSVGKDEVVERPELLDVTEEPNMDIDDGELAAIAMDETFSTIAVSDADEIKAELVDFTVGISLSDSTVRRRQLSEAQLQSFLDSNLVSLTGKALKTEMRNLVKASEIDYARPADLRLTKKGTKIEPGKSYEVLFGGNITFKKKRQEQKLPSKMFIRSMQVRAMDGVSQQMFNEVTSGVPGSRVTSAIASVNVPKDMYTVSPESNEETEGPKSVSSDTTFAIILACAIGAGVSLLAMAAVLIMRSRRRSKKAEDNSLDFPEKPKESNASGKRDGKIQMNSTMDSDENQSPANSPVKKS